MSRRSISAIVVGVLVLALTFMIFSNIFDATAPSESEFNAVAAHGGSAQALMERSQQAEGIKTLFYFIAGVEVIITGLLAYQWHREH